MPVRATGRGYATQFRSFDHETSISYFLFHDCHWLLAVLHLGVSGTLLRRLFAGACSGLASYIATLVLLGGDGDEHTGTNPAKSVGAIIAR